MGDTILIIGGTGYIGGSVLSRLFHHPKVDPTDVTVLVRSQEKAEKLESFHFKPVVGSTADRDLLERLAEQAQIVFSCADADDLSAIETILSGLKKRFSTTGVRPILIHTSGTGVIATEARGMFPSETIYDDTDVEQLKSIPKSAPHRIVDLTIVKADQDDYVRSHIVLPSTIWGIASNPLVQAGIQNPYSQQIPSLIRASVDRRQGGMVGKGLAIWPDVNIEDVGDLFMIIFDAATKRPLTTSHGREGFYFAENGEHTWYSISKEISRVLVQKSIGHSDEPTPFSADELVKYWGSEASGNSYGSNSRCRANRSRLLGWQPLKTKDEMIASIEAEVDAISGSVHQHF